MSVEPRCFSPDVQGSSGQLGDGQDRPREPSWGVGRDPAQPRIFSQARILVPMGLVGAAGLTWGGPPQLIHDAVHGTVDIYKCIVLTLFSLSGYWLLAHGLWRRFGVDRDKVWTRFGHLFYREIHFDQVSRIGTGMERYKVWAGTTKINLDYNRFDYTLVYLRLLEELHHRRIRLPGADITDPDWEQAAQLWRNILAGEAYGHHQRFYATHPEQLARLNALTQPPDHYDT